MIFFGILTILILSVKKKGRWVASLTKSVKGDESYLLTVPNKNNSIYIIVIIIIIITTIIIIVTI